MFILNVRNIEAKTKEPIQATTRSILESRVAFCLECSKNIHFPLDKICGPDKNRQASSMDPKYENGVISKLLGI